jgi:hypothetical protein
MSSFWKALIATAVPITAVSITAMIVHSASGALLLAVLGLCLAAIVAGVVFAVTNRARIAAGVFAGLGIGLLAAVTSCFAVSPQ